MSSGRVRKLFDSWILQDWADRVVWNYQSTMGSAVWFEINKALWDQQSGFENNNALWVLTILRDHCGISNGWTRDCFGNSKQTAYCHQNPLCINRGHLQNSRDMWTIFMHCACEDKFGNQLYLWIGIVGVPIWISPGIYWNVLLFHNHCLKKSLHRSKADWQLSASLLALWCLVGQRAGGGG